jgi:glycosyltransferase involved in cell wall biosynthesis
MPRLSATIITKNEAANIRECLESISFADEIIVLDSGSDDGTTVIAREMTDKVFVSENWPGFGAQKNRALEYATGDWVLSIDADERVSTGLRAQIEAAIADPAHDGYRIPRLSSYCGRFMRHGGWWPDPVLRLFRRGKGRFDDRRIHESVIVDGRVGDLDEPLIHHSFESLDDVVATMNRYSTDSARMLYDAGKRANEFTAIIHGVSMFVRTYFLKAGFLDGREGFSLAVANAEGSFYRYLKLAYLARESDDNRKAGRV